MTTVDTWKAQTMELVAMKDAELAKLNEKLKAIEEEKRVLEEEKKVFTEALRIYGNMRGAEVVGDNMPSAGQIRKLYITGTTRREILRMIAQRNNNLLVTRLAIPLMVEANVFLVPENAPAAIYGVLKKSREFDKIGRGIFKLDKDKLKTVKRRRRIKHGAKARRQKAIRSLKPVLQQLATG